MAQLSEIVRYLDTELQSSEVPDYDGALNGLQLANDGTVSRVAAAVDFSANSIAGAIGQKANLLIVHHGMYWGGAQPLVGLAYDRLRTAIGGDLAIYSSHIPLDMHPSLGNNALLAEELELESDGAFGRFRGVEIGVTGTCDLSTQQLVGRVKVFSAKYRTTAVSTNFEADRRTRRWAIITGAGANPETLAEARERGVDTLIVGEGTHHTAVEAMEHGLVAVYGGHYATETLGVQALAAQVSEHFDVPSSFVDVPTGL